MEQQSLGAHDCVDKIVDKYAGMVYKLAFARTRSRSEADDIFQEVFLRYISKCPQFESEEHEKAWFCRVTINCANTFWANPFQRRTEPLDQQPVYELTEPEPPEHDLEEYLNKLNPNLRVVIHLYYFEQYSTPQIAELLHKKESTIRMRLVRARRILKDWMEGDFSHV